MQPKKTWGQNGAKTLLDGAVHTYIDYIREYPPGVSSVPGDTWTASLVGSSRRDEGFQVTPFHPACLTASLKTFSAPSLPTRLTAPVQGSGFHLATYIQMKIYSSQKLNAYCVMLRFVLRISKESGP